jgi:hypothetical protein
VNGEGITEDNYLTDFLPKDLALAVDTFDYSKENTGGSGDLPSYLLNVMDSPDLK